MVKKKPRYWVELTFAEGREAIGHTHNSAVGALQCWRHLYRTVQIPGRLDVRTNVKPSTRDGRTVKRQVRK